MKYQTDKITYFLVPFKKKKLCNNSYIERMYVYGILLVMEVLLRSYGINALNGPLHGVLASKTDQCAAMQNKNIDVKTLEFSQSFCDNP